MKPRIVFIGGFTPLQKVLYELPKVKGVASLAVYTDLGQDKAVEQAAKAAGLDVYDARLLKTPDGIAHLKALKPDWILNVNSTIILPPDVLNIPRHGSLNLHPGKLPEYAGLHVHQWAIRNGEHHFACTLHWMEAKIDTGAIAYSKAFPIAAHDTGLSLFMKCMNTGAEIVITALEDIAAGQMPPKVMQDLSRRTLYTNSMAQDGTISWRWPALQIHNFIRAADYAPLTSPTYTPRCRLKNGKEIVIMKTRMSDLSSRKAGELVALTDDGVVVGAGDGGSVLVTKIRLEDKTVIQKAQIASILESEGGDFYVREEQP